MVEVMLRLVGHELLDTHLAGLEIMSHPLPLARAESLEDLKIGQSNRSKPCEGGRGVGGAIVHGHR
jgi:hypothetical protein